MELTSIQNIVYGPREDEGIIYDVYVTEEELESLKGVHRDIRYTKVFEFLLPNFDGEG